MYAGGSPPREIVGTDIARQETAMTISAPHSVLRTHQRGQLLREYALVIALIAIVFIVALIFLGGRAGPV
jgi:hypothetical protein